MPQPQLDTRIKGRAGYGLIQLVTGDGKGKTTSALGQALRARGAGKAVAVVYFDKGGDSHYSERALLPLLGIDFFVTGRDRIDPVTNRFDFSITDLDRTQAARGLAILADLFAQAKHDLVIADEINSTTALGMLAVADVLPILNQKPAHTELVLTGRNAPPEFLDLAHLITDATLKKHYFYSGVPAREGLDY